MSELTVHLAAGLARHARGRTLCVALGAAAQPVPPRAGVTVAFGREFQREPGLAADLVSWGATPGRLLVLVPPFAAEPGVIPAPWEARGSEPLAGGETPLGRILAAERQYELRGALLPLERLAGQLVTGGWRRTPTSGMVVITTLPLWSLTVLDHRDALAAWMADALAQAGIAPDMGHAPASTPAHAGPTTPDEWALLLHLCLGPYASEEATLAALGASPIFRVDRDRAERALARLSEAGYTSDGGLTESGDRALAEGPYAHYARALTQERRRT